MATFGAMLAWSEMLKDRERVKAARRNSWVRKEDQGSKQYDREEKSNDKAIMENGISLKDERRSSQGFLRMND